jgi:hypothetical protein
MSAFIIESSDSDLVLKNKYGVYSKNEIEKQLKEGHLTIGELGDIYDLKGYQILHILRSLGIIYRNNLNDTRIFNSNISPSMHQVLLGTLLGDGFMKDPKIYVLGHGVSQMDYCYHIAERIHSFVASFGDYNTKSETKKSFSFWTYHHAVFIPYFQRFYSHGKSKKYITENTAPDLESEGLAYWYMDDGKYGKYGFNLCVGDITEQEGNVLIRLLKNKFNIETIFQTYNTEKDYHTIYVKAESRNRFLELITPYIIPSMQYKITGDPFPRIDFSSDLVVSRHMILCKKAGRFIRYFGDKEIQKVLKEKNSFKNPKKIYIQSIVEAIKNKIQVSHTDIRQVPSDEELKKLFDQDLTDGQIGMQLGFGRNRIAEFRRTMGFERKICRITPEQHKKLTELYSQPEMTIQRMMQKMGMSFYKIKDWISNSHLY